MNAAMDAWLIFSMGAITGQLSIIIVLLLWRWAFIRMMEKRMK